MTINFDNVLGSLARGGPGAVRYDGDSLTNDEEHQYRIDLAQQLEHDTELIKFPSDVGTGAAIAAAEEAIEDVRSVLLRTADGLRIIGEAAKAAAPAIRNGTAADPEVQEALRQSSKAYSSVPDIVPADDDSDIGGDEFEPGLRRGGPGARSSGEGDDQLAETSPRTEVSSASQGPQVQPATGQPTGLPAAGQAPAAAAQGPSAGGGPVTAPSAFGPGGGDGRSFGSPQKPKRDTENGPSTYPSGASPIDGSGVAPVPLVNQSVTGGRVDPGQISGRTASTAPSSGLPPVKQGPAGSLGAMGGMGPAPLGGAVAPGGGGAARPEMPQPRRDRASERILNGEEARDKALVSHILRDDDPIAGEYIDSSEVLADLLPDERHPVSRTQTGAELPVVMDVSPPDSFDNVGFAEPIQYPGEPRDDEKW